MDIRQLRRIPVLPSMKKYGDTTPLYTRGVALYAIFFSVILVLQWFVDMWAWSNTWGFTYAAGDSWGWIWSRVLGFAFSTVILIFEIMYITQDTSTTTILGDIFRLMFAVFVGFGLTSVAVEVSWFAPDIEKSIVAEEKANVDKVVQMANALEEKKSEQLLAAAKQELGANAATQAEKAQQDIDTYVALRKEQRKAMTDAADTARDAARSEAAGKFSSHYGNGPAAQMMSEQAEKLDAGLGSFDAQTAVEVKRLTMLRDDKQKGDQQALQARLDKIRTDTETAVNHIAQLSETAAGRDQLAAKYGGGSWQVSRGALRRFSKMMELTAEPWTPAWYVKWLCRCIMLVFTIVIIGGKRFAPLEWKQYCNRGQQSRAGHEEAQKSIALEGFDPKMYGLNPEIRKRLAMHFTARQKLVEAHLGLRRTLCELARPEANGICRTLSQIEAALQRQWLEEGETHRIDLVKCEMSMALDGISVPDWPAMLGSGSNLLRDTRPWIIGKHRLVHEYAWVDPDKSIEERQRLIAAYQANQDCLMKMLSEQEGALRSAIEATPLLSINVLRNAREDWVDKTLRPLLTRMDIQERRICKLGGEVPVWPRFFADPRPTIIRDFADLDPDKLRRLGWVGPGTPVKY